ncbi:MAG: hypothetical protein IPK12_08645 [Gemmatimonadetes bacterium]|nr:hypothetical protein [Gemmatimonadota bacterium]
MLLLSLATLLLTAPPVPTGTELVQQMRARYDGKWYRTLTFVQTTHTYGPTPRTETWYEAARIPGMLRIDVAPVDSGKTIFFRNDSIYQTKGGAVAVSRALVHPLMVLGFDVYLDPVEKTVARLQGLGFDLTKVHETTWQGTPVYVVGALAGDTTSKQFWVEKDRLLFVRMLEPVPDGSGRVSETQFNRYQPLGRGWIAVEVVFKIGDQVRMKEEYADVRGDVTLPEALWDPARYGRPGWVQP